MKGRFGREKKREGQHGQKERRGMKRESKNKMKINHKKGEQPELKMEKREKEKKETRSTRKRIYNSSPVRYDYYSMLRGVYIPTYLHYLYYTIIIDSSWQSTNNGHRCNVMSVLLIIIWMI
jgi:hypothetical protein